MAKAKPKKAPAKKPYDPEKPRESSVPIKKPTKKPSPFAPSPINPKSPVTR